MPSTWKTHGRTTHHSESSWGESRWWESHPPLNLRLDSDVDLQYRPCPVAPCFSSTTLDRSHNPGAGVTKGFPNSVTSARSEGDAKPWRDPRRRAHAANYPRGQPNHQVDLTTHPPHYASLPEIKDTDYESPISSRAGTKVHG